MKILKILASIFVIISVLLSSPTLAGCNANIADLNGTTQYFTAADSASLSLTPPMTVEGWFNFDDVDSVQQLLQKNGSIVTNFSYYLMFNGGTDKLYWLTYSGDNTGGKGTYSSVAGTFVVGTWYHIAVTNDASGNVMFFVNGTKLGDTITAQNTSFYDSIGLVKIGVDFGDNRYYFNGKIDEIRFSNSVRWTTNFSVQTEEYADDANANALWHLNNSLVDDSGNSNSLTNVNSITFPTTPIPFGTCVAAIIPEEDFIIFN